MRDCVRVLRVHFRLVRACVRVRVHAYVCVMAWHGVGWLCDRSAMRTRLRCPN
jgi:hypothetical protein